MFAAAETDTSIDTDKHRPPRLRVLVADDHPVVRAGMVAILEREPDLIVVSEAAEGLEAVERWQTDAPDIGLVDLSMPGLDGFEVVKAIRRGDSDARLVVMTTLGGDEDVFRAMQAGAGGYLLKDCGAVELVHCMRSVWQGRKYLQGVAAHQLAERITAVALTSRERDVLSRLAEGLSNKLIARHLGMAEGTVKTHVKSLLFKLDASSRTQAARMAVQRGLVRAPLVDNGLQRAPVSTFSPMRSTPA